MDRVSGNLGVARAMARPQTQPDPIGGTRPFQCPEERGQSGAVRNAATHRAKDGTRPSLPRRKRPPSGSPAGDSGSDSGNRFENKTIPMFLYDYQIICNVGSGPRGSKHANACDMSVVGPSWEAMCADVCGRRWADIGDSNGIDRVDVAMQVLVKTLSGKIVTLDVSGVDLVSDVKDKIQDEVGVPVVHQRLLFDGKQLDDVRLVSSYGIRKESTLRLLVRGRGGAPVGPSLDVLADLLKAEGRRELAPDGRCLLCCARYGKDKWGDEWHWDAGPHQKAKAWARRQLDGNYLLDNWCVPCGVSAGSA